MNLYTCSGVMVGCCVVLKANQILNSKILSPEKRNIVSKTNEYRNENGKLSCPVPFEIDGGGGGGIVSQFQVWRKVCSSCGNVYVAIDLVP